MPCRCLAAGASLNDGCLAGAIFHEWHAGREARTSWKAITSVSIMSILAVRHRREITAAFAALFLTGTTQTIRAQPPSLSQGECEQTRILRGWIKMCGKNADGRDVCLCQENSRFESDPPSDPAVVQEQQRLLQQGLQRRAEQARQNQDETKRPEWPLGAGRGSKGPAGTRSACHHHCFKPLSAAQDRL
jgi:hypothetical protein